MLSSKSIQISERGGILSLPYVLLAPKKTDNDVEIVKIVNVFKKIWKKAILMRKDVPNPEKLVWGPYD